MYFGVSTRLLSKVEISEGEFSPRGDPGTKLYQILTRDVIEYLKEELPDDAYCLLAITMTDLYPHERWNFVFGEASSENRVGVFSLARYDPAFYRTTSDTEARELLLRRACKVLAHEAGHMFGLRHCVYYECLENGSNHLVEFDSRPLHLCPICLRKLQHNVKFDPIARYRSLQKFYEENGLFEESKWLGRRLGF